MSIRHRISSAWSKTKVSALRLGLISPSTSTDVTQWQEEAQEFEFDFHKKNLFRQSDAFVTETEALFSSFGFHARDFVGKTVIDIGAGSRLRGKYFLDANLIALEPLADRFIKEIPWCDLTDAAQVISQPAEILIPSLVGAADFVFSINVLDHCFDFPKICQNIHSYLSEEGLAFLSFDSHLSKSLGHPLTLTEKISRDIFENCGLKVVNFQQGFPQTFLEYHRRNGYDGKSPSLNFFLRRSACS